MTIKLSQYDLKVIACIAMTLDHIPKLMFQIQAVEAFLPAFVIGRISAPLFLFALIASLHHTRSRVALISRLYITNIILSLSTFIFNYLFSQELGIWDFSLNNITITFAFVGIIVWAIEYCRDKTVANRKKVATILGFLSYIVISTCIWIWFLNNTIPYTTNYIIQEGISSLVRACLPSPLFSEYSVLFILMGVLWYFAYENTPKVIVIFVSFCLISLIGSYIFQYGLIFFSDFFDSGQWKMILALPLLLFYSGERGQKKKAFFYSYYILHRYVLIGLTSFYVS